MTGRLGLIGITILTSVAHGDGWDRLKLRYENGVPAGIHTRENKTSLEVLKLSCKANNGDLSSPALCQIVKMIIHHPDAQMRCHIELVSETLELEREAPNAWAGYETLPCNGSRQWRASWEKIPTRSCENAWNLSYTETYEDSADSKCAGLTETTTTAIYRGANNCSTALPQDCKYQIMN